MVVLGWWGGVGAGASHTSLFGAPFSVSLALIYVNTVSYVVAAKSGPGSHHGGRLCWNRVDGMPLGSALKGQHTAYQSPNHGWLHLM